MIDDKPQDGNQSYTGGTYRAREIINTCIKCGCCNDICPTFNILEDELDSPRGRINLIKDMIETDRAADAETVAHIDRCLSCNACLTACPSDVDYMHLIDFARVHIEETYRRPLLDRFVRNMLARTLSDPDRFSQAMKLGRPFRGVAPLLKTIAPLKPLAALLDSIPAQRSQNGVAKGTHAAVGEPQKKVLIPSGCVQQALDSEIDRAAVNLLQHVGVEVILPDGDGCCGALVLHLGKSDLALDQARNNVDTWYPLIDEGLDAIVITATGCGTTIKDYGHLFRDDPDYRDRAQKISEIAVDVTEFLTSIDLPKPVTKPKLKVAYHAACSLQHAQKILNDPRKMLLKAGFKQVRPEKEHMCCGSAGTYSILQSELSAQLQKSKVDALEATGASVITAGNIGCLQHIRADTKLPVIHIVRLLNWSYTGEKPDEIVEVDVHGIELGAD